MLLIKTLNLTEKKKIYIYIYRERERERERASKDQEFLALPVLLYLEAAGFLESLMAFWRPNYGVTWETVSWEAGVQSHRTFTLAKTHYTLVLLHPYPQRKLRFRTKSVKVERNSSHLHLITHLQTFLHPLGWFRDNIHVRSVTGLHLSGSWEYMGHLGPGQYSVHWGHYQGEVKVCPGQGQRERCKQTLGDELEGTS